jgi:cobalt-precorrin 5A hydrolase/precorrin-3B C17-methyltransferase
VVYRPGTLVVGIGCVRGATADELGDLVRGTLERHGLAMASVRELATIAAKRDEQGIVELADRYGWPVRYFGAADLAAAGAPSGASEAVERAVGAPGVCEPAALLASGAQALIVPKTATGRATVAVACAAVPSPRGHLAVVGIGPGAPEHLTGRVRRLLEDADAVVGYHGYLDQVRPWLGPKVYYGSAIGEETERADLAIALSRAGRTVTLVSSGDAGVYGTAGIVLERLAQEEAEEEAAGVEVVPGVSAAMAAAALLGAPLMNDFAAISLSDLLTPWPAIERRLEAAAAADLVIALYNPASSQRRQQIAQARQILLRHRPPSTPVGIVRNAYRPGQEVTVTDLEHMLEGAIDMLAIVLIGNSATVRVGGRLVTRRGYEEATLVGRRREAARQRSAP